MLRKVAQIGIISVIFTLLLTQIIYAKPVVPSGEAIGVKLTLSGLLVEEVEEGSVAVQSGLRKGDFIKEVREIPKEATELAIIRNGKERNI